MNDLEAAIPQYDIDEFNRRWLKARVSAFRSLGSLSRPSMEPDPDPTTALEAELVGRFLSLDGSVQAPEADKSKDALLRAVFENSRKLALSLAKRLGVTFEVQDFRNLLESSGIPCVQGRWSERSNARILGRKGCDFCIASGANACDYWREALDGLVMGLGEKERLARHACVRHGDEECLDVFYTESAGGTGETLAWGPVPGHMALELFECTEYFRLKNGVTVDLKGFREGVLFFEFKTATDAQCGSSNLLTLKFREMVQEKYPGLILKDVTPQAVLGEQAG